MGGRRRATSPPDDSALSPYLPPPVEVRAQPAAAAYRCIRLNIALLSLTGRTSTRKQLLPAAGVLCASDSDNWFFFCGCWMPADELIHRYEYVLFGGRAGEMWGGEGRMTGSCEGDDSKKFQRGARSDRGECE